MSLRRCCASTTLTARLRCLLASSSYTTMLMAATQVMDISAEAEASTLDCMAFLSGKREKLLKYA